MIAGASPEAILSRSGARTRPIKAKANGAHAAVAETMPPHRLRLLTLADCAAARPRGYIVKGLLAPGDLAVMFGPPGAGKSVIAPFVAHAVAAGRSIFGRRVHAGPVLYLSAEDGTGMQLRAAALLRAHGDANSFVVAPDPLNLQGDGASDPADLAAIVLAAERIGAVLIVLDTLAAAFPGLDENDGRDMGRAVRLLRKLRAPDRAVLAIHHGAKSGGTTPRGHGVLDGAADVTLRIEVPDDLTAPRTVKLGKNRNGSTLAGLAFTIRAETMGQDDDGDAITAPVAVEAEGGADGTARAKALTPQQRTALAMLTDVVLAEGQPLPAARQMPADLRAVPIERWAAECARCNLSTSDNPKNRRDVFNRIAGQLRDRGAVAFRGGTVWATR